MLSYHSDESLKQSVLNQLESHYKADEIVKGIYWQEGKGCAVGCILHEKNGNHYLFEEKFGIPKIIASLIDRIFEGLPNEESKEFPLKVMDAIPIGKDLSNVWNKFVIWMLEEIKIFSKNQQLFDKVILLYKEKLDGKCISFDQWKEVKHELITYYAYFDDYAAPYIAAYAVLSYAYITDADYTYVVLPEASAVYSADYAADAYAHAYHDNYDEAKKNFDETKENFYMKMSDKLISILKNENLSN